MSIETALLALILLAIMAGAGAAALVLRRLRATLHGVTRRIDKLQAIAERSAQQLEERFEQQPEMLAKWFDQSIWPQIEGLTTVYRIIDREPVLPPTRRWAASPDFLRHLLVHLERARPRLVVECGAGTSTLALALGIRALGLDCHVYSLENHPRFAGEVRETLRFGDLEQLVTIVEAPLTERRYPISDEVFEWYDLLPGTIPDHIDMLVVDGPPGLGDVVTRYPAAPELFHKLGRDASIFVDDTNRSEEAAMVRLWRGLYPDLGYRSLVAEKGACELFFLDHKIEQFLSPAALAARSAAAAADREEPSVGS